MPAPCRVTEGSSFGAHADSLTTTPEVEFRFVAEPAAAMRCGGDWPAESRWEEGDGRTRRAPLPVAEMEARMGEQNARLAALGEPELILVECIGGRLYTGVRPARRARSPRHTAPSVAACAAADVREI